MEQDIRQVLLESAELKRRMADELVDDIRAAGEMLTRAMLAGGTVALCGNGGSAADAQHLSGELVGRFLLERPGYAAIALTTDTSILTAIGNDYSFEDIYARQVEALLRPGDVLVAFSTSGNACNCVRAVEKAAEKSVLTLALTGAGGGRLGELCDLTIRVPHQTTARVQEAHITIGHILCGLVERALVEAGR
jgi:D-sedoheptulose 7-phosphate isomerase